MSVFSKVGRVRTKYSVHNNSHRWLGDVDFGKLYPVYMQEVVPGDRTRISNNIVVRFMPMLAPLLHEINVFIHYFFIPFRILWDGWESYITGGEDGLDNSVKPLWNFDNYSNNPRDQLWRYMGHNVNPAIPADQRAPLDCMTQRGYNLTWNEWYRDTNLQDEVDVVKNNNLLYRSWRKDYFTSARTDTQLGEQPAIPIIGDLLAEAFGALPVMTLATDLQNRNVVTGSGVQDNEYDRYIRARNATGANLPLSGNMDLKVPIYDTFQAGESNYINLKNYLEQYVKVTGAAVDVNQLREIIQIQKWKERNMRAGARYVDFIKSRFDVSPRDDRLQRPEFIGGSRSPIVVSEVLQTSEFRDDVQGNPAPTGRMSGHGITVDRSYVCKHKCYEYGFILGLLSVMPKPAYGQGVERMWCRETRYDYFFPEFQHLGEQPVFNYEILDNGEKPMGIFGYQGRYNEMRHRRDITVGLMNSDLSHWHLGRYFNQIPNLNGNFIECRDVDVGRTFAVPSEPPMIVNVGNIVTMTRPMVGVPNPGLLDHF